MNDPVRIYDPLLFWPYWAVIEYTTPPLSPRFLEPSKILTLFSLNETHGYFRENLTPNYVIMPNSDPKL